MSRNELENCVCQDLDLLGTVTLSDAEPEFRRVNAGDVVWDSAAGDGKMVLVKEGSVRVYEAGTGEVRPRLAHVIGAGHWVGVESLAQVRGNTRIVAAEPTLVAIIDAKAVLERIANDPKSARAMIQHLARQSVQMSNEITELRTQDCTAQVAHALLRLSRCGGASAAEGNRVTLQITQQDVADAVGIARETVNAMIQKLAESGVIQKQRGRISFDPQALRQSAQRIGNEVSVN